MPVGGFGTVFVSERRQRIHVVRRPTVGAASLIAMTAKRLASAIAKAAGGFAFANAYPARTAGFAG